MSIDVEARAAGLLRRRKAAETPDPKPGPQPSPTPAPPRLPSRRNPKWVALGIVAVCVGGLLSYLIYTRVATETTVVAMAQTVHRGEVVAASDLTTVTLGGDPGVSTVPANDLESLVGQRAAYDLVDGAILPAGAISDVVVPASKRALVGIKLAAGRAPSPFLVPGAAVRLVAVPPANAEPGFADDYAGKTYVARVVDTQPGPDAASTLLDVDVSSDQAPVIALLSSQDRLTVVRDADR